jgi:hypothetical protein
MKTSICLLLLLFGFLTTGQTHKEISDYLDQLGRETGSTDELLESPHAKAILTYGEKALPILAEFFTDTSPVKTYSYCREIRLNKGELAIILADQIKGMPYAKLTHIQNCTMESCPSGFIEFYLDFIRRDGINEFHRRYLEWRKEEAEANN